MGKWDRRLRLAKGNFRLLLKTSLLLALIRLGLWLLPFRVLLKAIGKVCQTDLHRVVVHPIPIENLVWSVEVISRYMPKPPKCLARALTTKVLLHQQGYQPNLQIGVAKADDGSLEAHAWIDYQGQIVMGKLQDLSRFIPLPSVEGAEL